MPPWLRKAATSLSPSLARLSGEQAARPVDKAEQLGTRAGARRQKVTEAREHVVGARALAAAEDHTDTFREEGTARPPSPSPVGPHLEAGRRTSLA